MNDITTTDKPGRAIRMQHRLEKMTEAQRVEVYDVMDLGESERRVMVFMLGAMDAQLRRLIAALEGELGDDRGEST